MGGWDDLQSGQCVGCVDTIVYRGHIHSKLTEWMTPNNEKKIYNAIIFMKIVLILLTVNLNCK